MAYHKIVRTIPVEKRAELSVKLVDFILKSKNDEKMPSSLAKNILHYWRQGPLVREEGLAALLEAAFLLESEKTMDLLEQKLQLTDVAKAVGEFLQGKKNSLKRCR